MKTLFKFLQFLILENMLVVIVLTLVGILIINPIVAAIMVLTLLTLVGLTAIAYWLTESWEVFQTEQHRNELRNQRINLKDTDA